MFYRKYRPQTFEELDSEAIRNTLGKAVLAGNFSQAYLLCGPKGIGKTSAARLIAKAINCTKRKPGDEPCNECESCQSIISGRSLDVIEVDAASNTGVDDIRDLREKVKLSPTSSKYKVYIIDEVHMLSVSAFNALLKTLEEPPSHVVFILATTDPQKLPETVVSRCLRFDYSLATINELERSIKRASDREGLDIEPEAILEIARISQGSFRDGHKTLEQLSSLHTKIKLEDVEKLKSIVKKDDLFRFINYLKLYESKNALEWIEKFVAGNGNVKELVEQVISLLRQDLLAISGIGTRTFDFDVANLLKLTRKLEESYGLFKDSPITQLPLELAVVEWCMENKVPKEVKIPETEDTNDDDKSPVSMINDDQWKEMLIKLKPLNHSLVAFMRATRPVGISGKYLNIEVAYKFHMEKLSEDKNRRAVESVISDIIGTPVRVKFELKK